jgi:nucleotide-binding universal stress UspA family protein
VAAIRRILSRWTSRKYRAARSITRWRTRLAELSSSHAAGLNPDVSVSTGPAWRAILHAAAEAASDLIVMGAHGSTADGHFGSNVDRVVREAQCPVLVVRGGDHA